MIKVNRYLSINLVAIKRLYQTIVTFDKLEKR